MSNMNVNSKLFLDNNRDFPVTSHYGKFLFFWWIRQIAFNYNIIHVFIERYVFLEKTWGFSNEDWKSVAKAQNEKGSGVSYASTWLTDCVWLILWFVWTIYMQATFWPGSLNRSEPTTKVLRDQVLCDQVLCDQVLCDPVPCLNITTTSRSFVFDTLLKYIQ